MKKRVNLINRVSALGLSFFLALGLITPAFSITANAEAIEVLESSATVADCVMSYYAMSGSAIANTDWINTLYSSLGSSFGTIGDFAEQGLMTYVDGVWQPVEQLAENIANTSAYTSLGLDNVFNVSAEEVASGGGYAVATGASTLAGACGSVASTGILPILGGVTAAYWGGIAIGTLANHLIDKYIRNVETGTPVNKSDLLDSIPVGGRLYSMYDSSGNNVGYVICGSTRVGCYTTQSNGDSYGYLVAKPNTSSSSSYTVVDASSGRKYSMTTTSLYASIRRYPYVYPPLSGGLMYVPFNTNDEQTFSGIVNGTIPIPDPYSPDIIGSRGNQVADQDENGQYTVPDIKPNIDPGTESGKPLSLEDWLAFANGVSNNNNQTNPIPDNTELFQDILNAVKSIIPSPGPTPDPGPSPDPETYPIPGPVPDPSPVPDPDYQPETKPQPEYTEKPTENETDITEGDPWTTPDLLDKFPFCIPRDVYRVFTKLDSGARSAPHIQWRFNPNNKIDYTFDIDFSEWDSIATLLRTLELLGFIVALAVATRKMILS